jgi:signal transduction histidine kinase
MLKQLRFPIRFKILLTLLVVITIVVSVITFIMANLFHEDKKAYIHDLTSTTSLNAAAKTETLLIGYSERLQVFTRLMLDRTIPSRAKAKLLQKTFVDFDDFVSITLHQKNREPVTVFDAQMLESKGLSRKDLDQYPQENLLPIESILKGSVFIENSTWNNRLPIMTLAIANPDSNDRDQTVVAARILLDRLDQLNQQSQVFDTYIITADGTLLSHPEQEKVGNRDQLSFPFNLTEILGSDQMLGVREYDLNGVGFIGGFAPVQIGNLMAISQLPKSAAYLTARELVTNMLVLSLVLLVFSALLSLLWSRLITRPLERLSVATQELGKGQFDVNIEASSRDEIGDLANSFNSMATELDDRDKSLKKTQEALVQSEKMSAFGQLGAGIAHEVKNPLAGILGLAQLSLRKAGEDSPIRQNLTLIESETKRCQMIMENLLKFARKEEVAFDRVDINDVIEKTAAIVEHQLSINQVKLRKELSSQVQFTEGNSNQLQQVLMNLMINAQQAMKGKPGCVTVRTSPGGNNNIKIEVIDDGPGMPLAIRDKVFEPFFSTKPSGEGTGLGLSVSYGIIKEHNGTITVNSAPGEGSTFTLVLPPVGAGKS